MGKFYDRECACGLLALSIILHIVCLAWTGVPGARSQIGYEDEHVGLPWAGFVCEILSLITALILYKNKCNCERHKGDDVAIICCEIFTTLLSFLSAILYIVDLTKVAHQWHAPMELGWIEFIVFCDIIFDTISFMTMLARLCNYCCGCYDDDDDFRYRRLSKDGCC